MSNSVSAMEYENMEQKYIQTKNKLKKSLQYNERYTIQIQQLNKRLKKLETDNQKLKHQVCQIKVKGQTKDSSDSDVSSAINLNHEQSSLVEMIQSKNQQITDLLKDLEDIENENLALNNTLIEAKDELALATAQISHMIETLKYEDALIMEKTELIESLKMEVEDLKQKLQQCEIEKTNLKEEFDSASNSYKHNQVEKVKDEFGLILQKKEEQIEKLQQLLKGQYAHVVHPINDVTSEDEVKRLKIALSEMEVQLSSLKSEMRTCTKELKESTSIIKNLNMKKQTLEDKIEESKNYETKIKTQLKKAHERCQNMQKEVEYANKITRIFEDELSKLKDLLKQNEKGDLTAYIDEIQSLKIERLLNEKQLVSLIKDINKIQEYCNNYRMENTVLREQMGLSSYDTIEIDRSMVNDIQRQKKIIEKLHSEQAKVHEENKKLKLIVKNLKQQINEYIEKLANPIAQNVKDLNDDDKTSDIKTFNKENEALRNGLHELLSSVKLKTDNIPVELDSNILESLLKALSENHISGRYDLEEHHSMESVNIELTTQLHQTRTQLDDIKCIQDSQTAQLKETEMKLSERNSKEVTMILQSMLGPSDNILEEIRIKMLEIFALFNGSDPNLTTIMENEFNILQNHVDSLHIKCKMEKDNLLKKYTEFEKSICDYKPISISKELSPEELVNIINKENKKATYALARLSLMKDEVTQLRIENDEFQQKYLKQTEALLTELAHLRLKIYSKNKERANLVDQKVVKEIQNSLNEILIKYRELLSKMDEKQIQHDLALEILARREVNMKKEINELKEKLSNAVTKLNENSYKSDPNILPFSQKLAAAEVEIISEKNRADHINNLYELVKEQLIKSEDKFVEFSKYENGLLQKNLAFQKRIVELEDEITLWVDPKLLEEKYNAILQEKEVIMKEVEELRKTSSTTAPGYKMWSNEKEQEMLGLKHEILDLTSTSDSKLLIDQLYCDLYKARANLRETQLQNDFLKKEVFSWELRYSKIVSENTQERKSFVAEIKALGQKNGALHNIIIKQRLQYHGCSPLSINEILIKRMENIEKEKHQAFLALQNALDLEEQFTINMPLTKEKNEPINKKLNYLHQKIQNQDNEIQNLERELFSAYSIIGFEEARAIPTFKRPKKMVQKIISHEYLDPVPMANPQPTKPLKILRNIDSQTEIRHEEENQYAHLVKIMQVELKNAQNQITIKENLIIEKETLLATKSKEFSEANEQIKTLNQQIKLLENSLQEFRNQRKIQTQAPLNGAGDGMSQTKEEQIMILKVSIEKAQEKLKQKDIEIFKYQSLLKEDKDTHSRAALSLEQEISHLKTLLATEQANVKTLEGELSDFHKKSIIVEKYVYQVRELETHLAELHTKLAQQQIRLDNAVQEANRWRHMAQERLIAMQELGESLNEQHNIELSSYKTDYEKLKELSSVEESSKKITLKQKLIGYIDPEIVKLCKDKDERIEKLTAKIKLMENGEFKINNPTTANQDSSENLVKECENLRTKYDSALTRERILKDEIRELKDHLTKRSNLSARSQKSERSVKEHLQKKIISLENEIKTLNEKIAQQDLLIEKHKLTANDDFEKWKKQKFWQENCKKLQKKLQEAEEEVRKLHESCSSYKSLLSRLEREKISLENRIKALKIDQRHLITDQDKLLLKEENERLSIELKTLQAKIDMQQQGASALGVAVMQEKLEAQERKIAVLELSVKGPIELRNEIEKLQTTMANLRKKNLSLEAENLELNLALKIYERESFH
ncbi:centrosomal protein of 290 kDa isoform X2 [Anthonomus grandis grandis]|uniref:centrosomal protein of 290 kDa isoform X2 n=1 Tax=Anthonomus grandis grandis TaxID=2921223 RepID=UPI002166797D|nr:centrosomal protein of 290 kDa isoform X2 [Anthonomus grandis grandis]